MSEKGEQCRIATMEDLEPEYFGYISLNKWSYLVVPTAHAGDVKAPEKPCNYQRAWLAFILKDLWEHWCWMFLPPITPPCFVHWPVWPAGELPSKALTPPRPCRSFSPRRLASRWPPPGPSGTSALHPDREENSDQYRWWTKQCKDKGIHILERSIPPWHKSVC